MQAQPQQQRVGQAKQPTQMNQPRSRQVPNTGTQAPNKNWGESKLPQTEGVNAPSWGRQGIMDAPIQANQMEQASEGVCNQCQAPGHRANACPQRQCYVCRQMGHQANNCPFGQQLSCEGCGQQGTTYVNCRQCRFVRSQETRNGRAGARVGHQGPGQDQ